MNNYVAYNLSQVDRSKGYVYQSKGYMSRVICHNPFLFNSDGSFNFDCPKSEIVCVWKIKKKTFMQRVMYKVCKLINK